MICRASSDRPCWSHLEMIPYVQPSKMGCGKSKTNDQHDQQFLGPESYQKHPKTYFDPDSFIFQSTPQKRLFLPSPPSKPSKDVDELIDTIFADWKTARVLAHKAMLNSKMSDPRMMQLVASYFSEELKDYVSPLEKGWKAQHSFRLFWSDVMVSGGNY